MKPIKLMTLLFIVLAFVNPCAATVTDFTVFEPSTSEGVFTFDHADETISWTVKGLSVRNAGFTEITGYKNDKAALTNGFYIDAFQGINANIETVERSFSYKQIVSFDKSQLPAVYIHMSGDDVESKMLAAHGIIEESKEEVKNNLQPIECPRCKTKNPHDSKYCSTCSMILDMKLANEVEDTAQKIPDVLTMLLSDPDKMKMLSEKLNEIVK